MTTCSCGVDYIVRQSFLRSIKKRRKKKLVSCYGMLILLLRLLEQCSYSGSYSCSYSNPIHKGNIHSHSCAATVDGEDGNCGSGISRALQHSQWHPRLLIKKEIQLLPFKNMAD